MLITTDLLFTAHVTRIDGPKPPLFVWTLILLVNKLAAPIWLLHNFNMTHCMRGTGQLTYLTSVGTQLRAFSEVQKLTISRGCLLEKKNCIHHSHDAQYTFWTHLCLIFETEDDKFSQSFLSKRNVIFFCTYHLCDEQLGELVLDTRILDM